MKILNALGYGGQMMAIGMVVVFLGLIILIVCIEIMSAIFKKINAGKAAKAAQAAQAAAPAVEPAVEAAPAEAEAIEDDAIDPQVIAVISAAIAAFDGSNKNLVVRRVRRAPGWKGESRREQIYRF